MQRGHPGAALLMPAPLHSGRAPAAAQHGTHQHSFSAGLRAQGGAASSGWAMCRAFGQGIRAGVPL